MDPAGGHLCLISRYRKSRTIKNCVHCKIAQKIKLQIESKMTLFGSFVAGKMVIENHDFINSFSGVHELHETLRKLQKLQNIALN